MLLFFFQIFCRSGSCICSKYYTSTQFKLDIYGLFVVDIQNSVGCF